MRRGVFVLIFLMSVGVLASDEALARTAARPVKLATKRATLLQTAKGKLRRRAAARTYDPTAYLRERSALSLTHQDSRYAHIEGMGSALSGVLSPPSFELSNAVACTAQIKPMPCAPDDRACRVEAAPMPRDFELREDRSASLPDGRKMAKLVLERMREQCKPIVRGLTRMVTPDVGLSLVEETRPEDSGDIFDISRHVAPRLGLKAQF